MITFHRKELAVVAHIETGLKVSKSVHLFEWNCKDEYSAELLVKHLKKEMRQHIKNTRESEYNRGWKDAKAKKRKESWFRGWFEG